MYGYFMLTRKCPFQSYGKQQVDEECGVNSGRCAVLGGEEGKEEEVSAPVQCLQTLSHSEAGRAPRSHVS